MSLGSILHKVVLLRPLLRLFGVKDKTVAAKIGEGLTVIDGAVNEKKRGDEGVVLLVVLCLILMFSVVIMCFPTQL